jgi:hypothetical protein
LNIQIPSLFGIAGGAVNAWLSGVKEFLAELHPDA